MFIGAWVPAPMAAAVGEAVQLRGFRSRSQFLRSVLRSVVDDQLQQGSSS